MNNELEVGPLAVYQNSSTQIQRDALNKVKELTTSQNIKNLLAGKTHDYEPYTLPKSRFEKIDPLSLKKRAERYMEYRRYDVLEQTDDVGFLRIDPHIESLLENPDDKKSERGRAYATARHGMIAAPVMTAVTTLSFILSDTYFTAVNGVLTGLTLGMMIITGVLITDEAEDYIGEEDVKKIKAHLDETGYIINKKFHDQQYRNLNNFVYATIDEVMDTQAWASDQLANTRSQIDLITERKDISQQLHELDVLKQEIISTTDGVNNPLIAEIEILTESLLMRIAALHYWATRVHNLDDQFIKLARIEKNSALSQNVITMAKKIGTNTMSTQQLVNMAEEIDAVCFKINTLAQLLDPHTITLEPVDTSHLLSAAQPLHNQEQHHG